MLKQIFLSTLLIVTFFAPLGAQADLILSPGSIWEYTFSDPTSNTNWNKTTGGWSTGPAPFGNNTGGYGSDPGNFDYKTYWAADNSGNLNDDLWVRTAIDLTGYDLASITWDLGVDNGFKLYANGNLIANAIAEGYTYQWEYSGNFSNFLTSGVNVIAVALEDHGGLTAFDMQITGTHTPVPEPISMLLFGTGLVGVGGYVRKKLKK